MAWRKENEDLEGEGGLLYLSALSVRAVEPSSAWALTNAGASSRDVKVRFIA